jgi:hypothetical protein
LAKSRPEVSRAKKQSKAPTPEPKSPVSGRKRKANVVEDDEDDEDQSPVKRKKAPAKALAKPTPKTNNAKRGKNAVVSDDDIEVNDDKKQDDPVAAEDDIESPVQKGRPSKGKKRKKSVGASKEPAKEETPAEPVVSDSDLSSLIDETPKKKRQKRAGASKAKSKSKAKKEGKKAENLSPDEAEIKSLQGWLLKCGVRKMWFRELAPYPTADDKIAHLKDLLREAGMDGRYSVEKAKQIKDRRELEADLEAVQDYSKRYGNDHSEGRPKRGAAKVLADLGFGDEDSDED